MDRSQAIAILKRHERELRALGIEQLSLFGSTARGTATEGSDVDIVVRLTPGSGLKKWNAASRTCLGAPSM
jgi:predicted nucleotidyltransferase